MILWSFIMLFASAVECFIVQLAVRRDDISSGEAIDKWSRIAFPVVYLIVLVMLVSRAMRT